MDAEKVGMDAANSGGPDSFTPLTSAEQRLDQLVAYLEEHRPDADPGTVVPPLSPAAGQYRDSWLADVARLRVEANTRAARLGDAIVHASILVLGSGLNHSLPYVAYAEDSVTWTDHVLEVDRTPAWPMASLRRRDGGVDPAPHEARHSSDAGTTDQDTGDTGDTSATGGTVQLRVFRPTDPTGALILAAHGGSWWMGDGEARESLFGPDAAALAQRSGAVVIDVDYRLAPEHPQPAAVSDLLAALQWAWSQADDLGVDPTKFLLWGTSSGGHAAVLAAEALPSSNFLFSNSGPSAGTAEAPALAGLLLTVPSLDLQDRDAQWLEGVYGAPVDRQSAFVSPLLADVSDLPPVHVQVATRDGLAETGKVFAEAVAQAGGRSTVYEFLGTHLISTPTVQRQRITDLAAAVLELTGTARELPADPDGEYDNTEIDRQNQNSWGPVLTPDEL